MSYFDENEPIPVLNTSPYADAGNGYRFNAAWSEILVGLLESSLSPDFWLGTPTELDSAHTHALELMEILSGLDMRNIAVAKHVESSGANGGSVVSGSWYTRTLNGLDCPGAFCSLSGDVLTLDPGFYWVRGACVGHAIGLHMARLSISYLSQYIYGLSSFANDTAGGEDSNRAVVEGFVSLPSSAGIALQHRGAVSRASWGQGYGCGFGNSETYAILRVVKLY